MEVDVEGSPRAAHSRGVNSCADSHLELNSVRADSSRDDALSSQRAVAHFGKLATQNQVNSRRGRRNSADDSVTQLNLCVRHPNRRNFDAQAQVSAQSSGATRGQVSSSSAMGQRQQRPASASAAHQTSEWPTQAKAQRTRKSASSSSPSKTLASKGSVLNQTNRPAPEEPTTRINTSASATRDSPSDTTQMPRPQHNLQSVAPRAQSACALDSSSRLDKCNAESQDREIPSARVKTTRVRINSTSEQIQDPNWLIRMSLEMESARRTKRSHLKNLHRKIKSTISKSSLPVVGSGSGNGNDQQHPLNQDSSQDQNNKLNSNPASAQTTPVKVPVSILKQPGNLSLARNRALNSQLVNSNDDKPTVPMNANLVASPQSPIPDRLATSQQTACESIKNSGCSVSPTRPGSSLNRSPQVTRQSPQQQIPSTKNNQTTRKQHQNCTPSSSRPPVVSSAGTQQSNPISTDSSPIGADSSNIKKDSKPQVKAICADGQVKVSGWKRNNLLARTLSHFDEIRGNQRPVFVPTKITLPTGERSPADGITSDSKKFADIVHEAILKKNLLASTLSETSPSSNRSRTSDGELRDPLTASHHEAIRSVSAGANQNQTSKSNKSSINEVSQQRCSSAAGGSTTSSLKSKTKSPSSAHNPALSRSSPVIRPAVHLLSNQRIIDLGDQPASARQLKLQLKNNQLLQNLRRQSNEINSQSHLAEQIVGSNGQATGGSAHLKDWKRLTNKLGLLTGLQHNRAKTLLSLSQDSDPKSNLRLTLSNQESGRRETGVIQPNANLFSHTKRGSSSQQLLVPGTKSPTRQVDSEESEAHEQERKLSSSSMVVQPVSSIFRRVQPSRSAACSPLASKRPSNSLLQVDGQQIPRRSSDSETQRSNSSQQQPQTARRNNSAAISSTDSSPTNASPQLNPVVVNRNDLLQLLQVTGARSSPATSLASSRRESGASSTRDRRSLQLDSLELATLAGGCTQSICRTESSENLRRVKSTRRSESLKSLESMLCPELSSRGLQPLDTNIAQVACPKSSGDQSEITDTNSGNKTNEASKRRDLSWVVKRTSKVTFFHKKLRLTWKMRKQQQQIDLTNVTDTPSSAAADDESRVDLSRSRLDDLQGEAQGNGQSTAKGDVLLDPNLIGDAIEIFLRSAMQSDSAKGDTQLERPTQASEASEKAKQSDLAIGVAPLEPQTCSGSITTDWSR